MRLYFRLLWLYLTRSQRRSCTIFDSCETPLMTMPNDIDLLLHVNNGVFLTYLDLGRLDMMWRSGIAAAIARAGWTSVVAAESIRFRRSLGVFQRIRINTSLLGWDERSIYLSHHIVRGGETVAEALIEARVLGRAGERVTPAQLLAELDLTTLSPDIPAWVYGWRASMTAMTRR